MSINSPDDDIALSVNQIYKRFGDYLAVRGLSFSIHRGRCIGILGTNGAGKSTTLRICLGSTRADSGTVRLLGYPIPESALSARARVGVVPQYNNLDPDFNCIENLTVYGRYFGLSKNQIKVDYLLDFAGLSKRTHDRINTLSGGMQRRLTLARSLVNDPDFIFLDEPTTGLDPQARHLIWARLQRLTASGKTLLLTTHFLEEAERLCDYVYIMDEGKIIIEGEPKNLVKEQVEPSVVEIYGEQAMTWLDQYPRCYKRRESFGQLVYCYGQDLSELISLLRQTDYRFIHRCGNLEDIFLMITGRDLRE